MDCSLFLGNNDRNSKQQSTNLALPQVWSYVSSLSGNMKWISEVSRGGLEVVFKVHSHKYLTKLMRKVKHDDELNIDLTAALKACGAISTAISSIVSDANEVPHLRLPSRKVPIASNALVLAYPESGMTGRAGPISDATISSAALSEASVINYVAHGAIHARDLLDKRVAILCFEPAPGTEEIVKDTDIFFASVHATSRMEWLEKLRPALEKLRDFRPSVLIVSQAFVAPPECIPGIVRKLTLDLLSICTQLISVVEKVEPHRKDHLKAHVEALQASV
mmetsp:Transcript_3954/g.8460  ORF Transcript_3954/g.8460 Transcript_3954/m.8460 type:complete len:278 (-) Transcript_3954:90-923(-)